MDYRQELIGKIERYYTEVIEKYKTTTTEAMQAAKKPGLFKKVDYSGYLDGFKKHMEDALSIGVIQVGVPPEDVAYTKLAEYLDNSIHTFCQLCDSNIKFYNLNDKKQYRDSGVSMADIRDSFNVMQVAMTNSIKDLDILDKTYQQYTGNLADE